MDAQRWLLKTEPETYSWDTLVAEGRSRWDGVRNPRARGLMGKMRPDDPVFIYHTGDERAVVGIGRVVSPPYPDPTDPEGHFLAVDVAAAERLERPVTLAEVKAHPDLAGMTLARVPRLSVQRVTAEEWSLIVALAATPAPPRARRAPQAS